MAGETPTLFKMKDLWTYLSESFIESDKHLKKIRKAGSYSEYKIAVNSHMVPLMASTMGY